MQQGPAVSCSFGSWTDPCLKLPRIVGELNTSSCHLALSLPFRLMVFAPLFCGRTESFQCLGMGHNYLKLFIALARHCCKLFFTSTPALGLPCWHSACCSSPGSGACLHCCFTQHNFLAVEMTLEVLSVPHLCDVHVTRSECMSPEGKGIA